MSMEKRVKTHPKSKDFFFLLNPSQLTWWRVLTEDLNKSWIAEKFVALSLNDDQK